MTKAPETITVYHDINDVGVIRIKGQVTQREIANRYETLEYRRADLPPKVKALVWRGKYAHNSMGGLYKLSIQPDQTTILEYRAGGVSELSSHFAPDNAKAAAQTHHDKIVLGRLGD